MPKISINTGKGLTFNGNQLTVNASTSNGLIEKRSDGIYIPSLKGANGGAGGSIVDGLTVTESDTGARKYIHLDVDYVQAIFTMCVIKTTEQAHYDAYTNNSSTISQMNWTNPDNVKRISDIVNELNFSSNLGLSDTSYILRPHDLFAFKSIANARTPLNAWFKVEDLNRYPSSVLHGLFIIDEVAYGGTYGRTCTHLKMTCLWVLPSGAVSQVYKKGDVLEY